MQSHNLPSESIEQQLIQRYKQRIKTVFSNKNPYVSNPVWEISEINTKINELKRITK